MTDVGLLPIPDLQAIRKANLDYFMGDHKAFQGLPLRLQRWTEPDGGVINLIDQCMAMWEIIGRCKADISEMAAENVALYEQLERYEAD